jgi:hypothetical protein
MGLRLRFAPLKSNGIVVSQLDKQGEIGEAFMSIPDFSERFEQVLAAYQKGF